VRSTNVALHSPMHRQRATVVVLPRATSAFSRGSSPRSTTGAASQPHEETRPPRHPIRRLLHLLALLLCSGGFLGATAGFLGAILHSTAPLSLHPTSTSPHRCRVAPRGAALCSSGSPTQRALTSVGKESRQRAASSTHSVAPPSLSASTTTIALPSTPRQCLERRVAAIGMTSTPRELRRTN
jgi:hypothetical protein